MPTVAFVIWRIIELTLMLYESHLYHKKLLYPPPGLRLMLISRRTPLLSSSPSLRPSALAAMKDISSIGACHTMFNA